MKKGNTEITEARELFFTSEQCSCAYVDYAESIQSNAGLAFGIPGIDRHMIPFRAGNKIGIIGRPGHGKSTILAALGKEFSRQLLTAKQDDKRKIVYVSLEQPVEEIEVLFNARDGYSATDYMMNRISLDEIRGRALERVKVPIWLIGRSVLARRKMPRLTAENIYCAIRQMKSEFGVEPAAVLLDYIQIVPVDGVTSRQEQVSRAVLELNDLSVAVAAPFICGIQAARGVDRFAEQIPGMADCQWASDIEQNFDKLFSSWRPWLSLDAKDQQAGRECTVNGKSYPIGPNLLILKCIKQRFSHSGFVTACNFRPEYVHLSDMEMEDQPKQDVLDVDDLINTL